jgi:hypothetical protein
MALRSASLGGSERDAAAAATAGPQPQPRSGGGGSPRGIPGGGASGPKPSTPPLRGPLYSACSPQDVSPLSARTAASPWDSPVAGRIPSVDHMEDLGLEGLGDAVAMPSGFRAASVPRLALPAVPPPTVAIAAMSATNAPPAALTRGPRRA